MKDTLDSTKLKFSFLISGLLIVCIIFSLVFPDIAEACTAVYVGKDVSTDGQTIVARSVDAHPTNILFNTAVNPRVENQPGRIYKSANSNFNYPLPDTTYQYFSTPEDSCCGEGEFGSACTNEYGLAVSATVSCYTQQAILDLDPFNKDGISEEVSASILCMCSKNAREAVELAGKIVDEYGAENANSLVAADQKEAWMMEWYSGHQWAAIKLPTDKVSVYGNEFMIQTEYEVDNTDSFICSKDLFNLPIKAGLAVSKNGKMALAESYSGKDRLWDYANLRTYMGHYFLNPSTAGNYDTLVRYDLLFDPQEKVSLDKVFETLRYRYEGTPYCPDVNGSDDIRVIGAESQQSVHAIQVNPEAPEEIADTTWYTPSAAEHGFFLPYSNGLLKSYIYYTDTKNWVKDNQEFTSDEYEDSSIRWFFKESASLNFKKLSTKAEQNREMYGDNIRKFWKDQEQKEITEYKEVYAKAMETYKINPNKAKEDLSYWTINKQKEALAQCLSLIDELDWYIAEHTETFNHNYSYDTLTVEPSLYHSEPFEPKMVFFDNYINKLNDEENFYFFKINKIGFYVGAAALLIAIITALVIIITKKKKTNRD